MSGLRRASSTNFLSAQIETSEIDSDSVPTQPSSGDREVARMQGISLGAVSADHASSAEMRAAVTNHHPEFAMLPSLLVASSSGDHQSIELGREENSVFLSAAAEVQPEQARPKSVLREIEMQFEAFDSSLKQLGHQLLHDLQRNVQSLNRRAIQLLGQYRGNQELIAAIHEKFNEIDEMMNNPGKGEYNHEYQTQMLGQLRSAFELSAAVVQDSSIERGEQESALSVFDHGGDSEVDHTGVHQAAVAIGEVQDGAHGAHVNDIIEDDDVMGQFFDIEGNVPFAAAEALVQGPAHNPPSPASTSSEQSLSRSLNG